jgi:hypothetical protein
LTRFDATWKKFPEIAIGPNDRAERQRRLPIVFNQICTPVGSWEIRRRLSHGAASPLDRAMLCRWFGMRCSFYGASLSVHAAAFVRGLGHSRYPLRLLSRPDRPGHIECRHNLV